MARLLTDGAEFADLLFWDTINGDVSVVASGMPIGQYCYRFWYSDGYGIKYFTPLSELYWRMRLQFSGPSQRPVPCHFPIVRSGGNAVADFYFNGNNYIAVSINGVEVAQGSFLYPTTWYLFECYLKLADSQGRLVVYQDGIKLMDYTGDTLGAYPTVDNMYWQGSSENYRGYGDEVLLDDFALNDTSGAQDNSWCGNAYIEVLMPNRDGDVLQWIPTTSGSHFADLDERPNDGDTTRISALISTPKQDMLGIFPWNDNNKEVKRISVQARARDEGGSGQIKLGVKTSGSVFLPTSPSILTTTYKKISGDVLPINPMTGLAWTKTDLDALQIVIEGEV